MKTTEPASGRILVDTSVWIEFFRGREPCRAAVDRWIQEDRVVCVGLVLGELLQGARSRREQRVLEEFSRVFPFLPESPTLWAQAGLLSNRLRREGTTVGLADCYLAVSAVAAGVRMATLDRHFDLIAPAAGLRLEPIG
ncbi:type II toxin-antitoxin system VapC family toxin [Deferrisoma sp.]